MVVSASSITILARVADNGDPIGKPLFCLKIL